MVRLQRSLIPAVLSRLAPAATQGLTDAWTAGRKLTVRAAIYNHRDVKAALRASQHDKCAYCETLNPTSHDVVEHFRPKNGWRQTRSDALQKPEYFWLAYSWGNLLFACDRCNDGGHKQNLFPLKNPTGRANATNRNIERERPLLLDPYGLNDPERHIAWDRDVPRARNGSLCGRVTITTFALDADSLLLRERRKYLHFVEVLLETAEALASGSVARSAAASVLADKASPRGPWSAMIRANLGSRIRVL